MKIETREREQAREELYNLINQGDIDIQMAIKLIRKIYGMGQLEYAQKVGVSKKTITSIETGQGNPTIKSVNKLLAPMKLKLKVGKQ